MCVIVYLPKDIEIEEATLRSCHKTNPHSVGYMFADRGSLYIRKFLKLEDFLKAFHADRRQYPKADFAIHFRIATSGKVDIPNCHPFTINENIGMMHNGVLSCTPGDVEESDTNKFRQQLESVLTNRALWENEFFWFLIQETIGSFNKMVFMRKDGAVRIVNDKKGTWESGIWFSNTNWKPYVHTPSRSFWPERNTPGAYQQGSSLCTDCRKMWTFKADGICHSCADKSKRESTVRPLLSIAKNQGIVGEKDATYLIYMNRADMILFRHEGSIRKITRRSGLWEFDNETYLVLEDDKTPLLDKEDLAKDVKALRVILRDPKSFS